MKIYQYDVGTLFQLDVGEDVTEATTLQIRVKFPDDTTTNWTATQNEDDDNIIEYATETGDLGQTGQHLIRAYVVLPSWAGHGETKEFWVHEPWR